MGFVMINDSKEEKIKINMSHLQTIEIRTEPPKQFIDLLHAKEAKLPRYIFARFFDKKEYAENFLCKGTIKFNTLLKLKSLESFRLDNSEGEIHNVILDLSRFSTIEKRHIMGLLPLPDIVPTDISPNIKDIYVYCLSLINPKIRNYDPQKVVDIILKELMVDNYCVVIYDILEFLNQVKRATETQFKAKLTMGNVTYKETTPFDFLKYQDGDLFFRDIVFTKDINFSLEKEFRFAFNDSSLKQETAFVDIGSIAAYSELLELKGNKN